MLQARITYNQHLLVMLVIWCWFCLGESDTHGKPLCSSSQCASSTQKKCWQTFCTPRCSHQLFSTKQNAILNAKPDILTSCVLQHEPLSCRDSVSKTSWEHVSVLVVCVFVCGNIQAPVLWLTAAHPGCTDCFWIWVMQVHKLNRVQSSFKVTRTSLLSSMPTPTALLMPTIGNYFLVWQYQWEDKKLLQDS